jgi:hypothetical protein
MLSKKIAGDKRYTALATMQYQYLVSDELFVA